MTARLWLAQATWSDDELSVDGALSAEAETAARAEQLLRWSVARTLPAAAALPERLLAGRRRTIRWRQACLLRSALVSAPVPDAAQPCGRVEWRSSPLRPGAERWSGELRADAWPGHDWLGALRAGLLRRPWQPPGLPASGVGQPLRPSAPGLWQPAEPFELELQVGEVIDGEAIFGA